MKKYVILLLIMFLVLPPIKISAQRGCCSHHGGVAGCNSNGRQICNDGTLSPTCTCTPTVQYVYGCTHKDAKNYNEEANKDDGSCEYYTYGCTDVSAENYDIDAEKDDGSCEYKIDSIEENEKDLIDLNNIKEDIVYESIDSSQTEEDTNDDFSTGGLLFGLGASVLGTYIYRKKQKK